ncbi:MAG: SPASM domain-containing protein [Candidatus Omnitrophica bacterium]|nr:SPASM domain-containing protein [Candidatus Omnitrophota bacterium]
MKTVKRWKQFEYTKDPDAMVAQVLGAPYREYRACWEKAANCELVQDYPIHLDFELSAACNLQCPQCILQVDPGELEPSNPYHPDNRGKRIDFAKYKEIIDDGIRRGLRSVTFGVNNESLLIPDIARYVAYARSAGVLDVILITNGTLLTGKLSAELIAAGLTKLYFSIDAATESTYRIVRKGGDLQRVVSNIRSLLAMKRKLKSMLPVTRVSFVKSKINERELDEFVRSWKDKVDFVSIQAYINPAQGYPSRDAQQEMFYIESKDLKNPGPCPQPYQRLTIYHDGTVHPCCHWYGATLIVGNIFLESVYDIWNSMRMREIRRSVNSNDNKTPRECRICREAVFGERYAR